MSTEPLFAQTRIPAGIPSGSFTITPNDGADLPRPIMGLRVDTAGTVKFITAKGDMDTALLPSNGILVMAIARVLATGTDATGIHGISF